MLPTSTATPHRRRRRRQALPRPSSSSPSHPSHTPAASSSSSSHHTASAHPSSLVSSPPLLLLLLLLLAAPLPCAAQQLQPPTPPPSPPLPRVYRVAPALVTWTLDGGGDPALLTASDLANRAVVVSLRIGDDPNATAATGNPGGGGGGDGPLPPYVPNVFVPPRGSGTVSLAVSQVEGARRNGRGVSWALAEAGARGAEGVARFEYVSEWEARLVLGPVRGYMLLSAELVRMMVNTSMVTRGRSAALAPLVPAGGGGGGGGGAVALRFAPAENAAEPAAEAGAAAAAAVQAISVVSPGPALLDAQGIALLLGRTCADTAASPAEDGDDLGILLHPFGALSPSLRAVDGSPCLAAVACGYALLLVVALAQWLLIGVLHSCMDLAAHGTLKFPAASLFVFLYLYQGLTLCGARLVLYPAHPGHLAVGVVVTLLNIAVPAAVAWVLYQGVPERGRYRLSECVEDEELGQRGGGGGAGRSGGDDAPRRTCARRAFLFLVGHGEWVSTQEENLFSSRFSVVLYSYREERAWWCGVQALQAALLGAALAVRTPSYFECGVVRLACALLHLFSVALVLRHAPHCRGRDNAADAARFGLVAAALLCASVAYFAEDPSHGAMAASGALFLAALAVVAAKVVADVLTAFAFHAKRRERLQAAELAGWTTQPGGGGSLMLEEATPDTTDAEVPKGCLQVRVVDGLNDGGGGAGRGNGRGRRKKGGKKNGDGDGGGYDEDDGLVNTVRQALENSGARSPPPTPPTLSTTVLAGGGGGNGNSGTGGEHRLSLLSFTAFDSTPSSPQHRAMGRRRSSGNPMAAASARCEDSFHTASPCSPSAQSLSGPPGARAVAAAGRRGSMLSSAGAALQESTGALTMGASTSSGRPHMVPRLSLDFLEAGSSHNDSSQRMVGGGREDGSCEQMLTGLIGYPVSSEEGYSTDRGCGSSSGRSDDEDDDDSGDDDGGARGTPRLPRTSTIPASAPSSVLTPLRAAGAPPTLPQRRRSSDVTSAAGSSGTPRGGGGGGGGGGSQPGTPGAVAFDVAGRLRRGSNGAAVGSVGSVSSSSVGTPLVAAGSPVNNRRRRTTPAGSPLVAPKPRRHTTGAVSAFSLQKH